MLFSRKKNNPVDLSFLGTDMHSHLIPGIDDGSPDLETSVELVKGMKELGYKKLITTPHIFWDLYPNTSEIISKGIDPLRRKLDEAGVEMELHAAAEYFLDDHFMEELKNKTALLPLSGNILLVEFSMLVAPFELKEILFELQMQGYQPLIAHPERYTYLVRRKDFYDELKDLGCMFQMNILSLSGGYGTTVQELAEYLLKNNMYDYAGSDLHGFKHLNAMKQMPSSAYKKLKEYERFRNDSL